MGNLGYLQNILLTLRQPSTEGLAGGLFLVLTISTLIGTLATKASVTNKCLIATNASNTPLLGYLLPYSNLPVHFGISRIF